MKYFSLLFCHYPSAGIKELSFVEELYVYADDDKEAREQIVHELEIVSHMSHMKYYSTLPSPADEDDDDFNYSREVVF